MKSWLLATVAAVAVAFAAPAFAEQPQQPQNTHKPVPGARKMPPGQGRQSGPGHAAPAPMPSRSQPAPMRSRSQPTPQRGPAHANPPRTLRPVPKSQPRIQRFDWNRYQQGKRPPQWSQHKSFDMHRWQFNRRAEHRYHRAPYHRPSGWYARRWVFGMVLPTLFWTRDYWITDYWDYALPNPPYGYVWVRYGDDALLVNVSTGYILQVIYDLYD